MSDLRSIIEEAIEEWASTAFAPGAPKPNDPTLARYIEAKIHEAHNIHAAWGPITQHSIITPECRQNRTNHGAFEEAVARARSAYEQTVQNWYGMNRQPTMHLLLTVARPATAPIRAPSEEKP